MDKPEASTTPEQPAGVAPQDDMPPGDHPLEIAARRGIGPLSRQAEEVWHGNARPCVSCGLLVLRDQRECDHCGQDLSDDMLAKMRAHAGPWYVLEHLHPFPGVSLERIIRQIRRGVLTETSIIRGPATDYQWRFACETPGLCRYFGKCWSCHRPITGSDTYCPGCLVYLAYDAPEPTPGGSLKGDADTEAPDAEEPWLQPPQELKELSAALGHARDVRRDPVWDDPPRLGPIRATWVAAALLVLVIAVLMWVTNARSREASPPRPVTAVTTPAISPNADQTAPANGDTQDDEAHAAPTGADPTRQPDEPPEDAAPATPPPSSGD